ncbi:peptidase inhibitor family I36 protein [Rhodococcus corynebacterioides]|nr:peptidase inhibitor family I36 protein [Rhodococcus corynebacterioides]
MSRKFASAFAATVAALGLAVMAPGVADAATCSSGRACFFGGSNYTGSQVDVLVNSGVGCVNSPGNRSGLSNGAATGGTVWSNSNCSGSNSTAISSNFPFMARSVSFCMVCRPGE